MSRRKQGRLVDGILLLDKPVGMSSNFALQKVRRLFNARKAGHGGTLDPFAEGALPILFGEATKFGRYFLDGDKSYRVTMQFGAETDTEDGTGTVVREAPVPNLAAVDWAPIFAQFSGDILQMPPQYSALKVDGVRAYDLARRGEAAALSARKVHIDTIKLLAVDSAAGTASLEVACGKGTYIRSLVRDMARALGSAAHAVALRRTRIGHLATEMHTLDPLEVLHAAQDFAALDALLLPLDNIVAHLQRAEIPAEKLPYIRHGNDIETTLAAGEYALYGDGRFFGVGRCREGRLIPERLCRLDTE